MRRSCIFLLCCLLACGVAHAGGKRKDRNRRGLPRTEAGLMTNVLGCLQYKDSVSYFNLFVPFDTLWQMVIHNPSRDPEAIKELNNLKEHPQSLIVFDPRYNRKIMDGFYKVLQKGEDSGMHWPSAVMQRYEVKKEDISNKNLVGYELIAPERFKGYLFVRDILGRSTFCVAIQEIQKINGYFFGGQVTNILVASSVEEYWMKEEKERKYFEWLEKNPDYDSLRNDSLRTDSIAKGLIDTFAEHKTGLLGTSDEEDNSQVRKEVTDRKYYVGKFDNEIPVTMYIRYMKDGRTKKVSYYGLYKFGDQKSYARLIITRTDDGKWVIEDDPAVGSMDLVLKDKIYTGAWTNGENGTGYDVFLKQADIQPAKLEQLEKILDKKLSGSVNEDNVEAPEKINNGDGEEKLKESKVDRKNRKKEERRIRRLQPRAADSE
jgi:hypothetical protein